MSSTTLRRSSRLASRRARSSASSAGEQPVEKKQRRKRKEEHEEENPKHASLPLPKRARLAKQKKAKKENAEVVLPPPPEPAATSQDCPVCLEAVVEQGVLDSCQHVFCFECVVGWAKKANLCPLCQKRFSTITKLAVQPAPASRTGRRGKKRAYASKTAPEVVQVADRDFGDSLPTAHPPVPDPAMVAPPAAVDPDVDFQRQLQEALRLSILEASAVLAPLAWLPQVGVPTVRTVPDPELDGDYDDEPGDVEEDENEDESEDEVASPPPTPIPLIDLSQEDEDDEEEEEAPPRPVATVKRSSARRWNASAKRTQRGKVRARRGKQT